MNFFDVVGQRVRCGGQELGNLCILVACRDAARRTALLDILAQCAQEPVVAANRDEVRAVLAQRFVDLVFCEDDFPEGGFREVLRLSRARGSVTVVVCSLLGEMEQYLDAMELGALDFIAPPYRLAEVESILISVSRNCLPKGMGATTLMYSSESSGAT